MTGIGLIVLILVIVLLVAGVYMAAWWMCAVQRSHKQGHYILESDEEADIYNNKKLYAGLGK